MDHALPTLAPDSPPVAMLLCAAFAGGAATGGAGAEHAGPDASERLGRCLALAEALRRRGWQTSVATGAATVRTAPARLINLIEQLIVLDDAVGTVAERLAQLHPHGVDLLVIDDALAADGTVERGLRGWAACLLAIDERLGRAHAADLLLDETPRTAGTADWRTSPGRAPGGRVLAGADFALLPHRATALRGRALPARRRRGTVERVFVNFADRFGPEPVLAALLALSMLPVPLQIDVVLGADIARAACLRPLWEGRHPRVRLHLDEAATIPLLAAADLAIGCASRRALLRCALGVPCVVIEGDDQRELAAALDAGGACDRLGTLAGISEAELVRRLKALIEDDARRFAMAEAAARLCDGAGAARVAAALAPRLRTADGARHRATLRCLSR